MPSLALTRATLDVFTVDDYPLLSSVSPKGRNDDSGIRLSTLVHTYVYTLLFDHLEGGGQRYCETRSTLEKKLKKREIGRILGDNNWRVVGNSSISASASSLEAKSRRIFTAINFPKEDKRGLDAERCIIDARYSPNGAKVVVYLAITVKYLRLRRQVSWPIAADHFRPVKSSPLLPLRSPLLLYHHRPNRHR